MLIESIGKHRQRAPLKNFAHHLIPVRGSWKFGTGREGGGQNWLPIFEFWEHTLCWILPIRLLSFWKLWNIMYKNIKTPNLWGTGDAALHSIYCKIKIFSNADYWLHFTMPMLNPVLFFFSCIEWLIDCTNHPPPPDSGWSFERNHEKCLAPKIEPNWPFCRNEKSKFHTTFNNIFRTIKIHYTPRGTSQLSKDTKLTNSWLNMCFFPLSHFAFFMFLVGAPWISHF